MKSSVEHLIAMANDIAAYFRSEPDRDKAVEGVRDHIARFWEPRMRQKILAHWRAGGEGLDDLARTALGKLA